MWASPSGVVTGGAGMLMTAVVMWLLRQFREADSLRLERLQGETRSHHLVRRDGFKEITSSNEERRDLLPRVAPQEETWPQGDLNVTSR